MSMELKRSAYIVPSVAFSPDGRYTLTGSFDSTLKLWDVSTGEQIRIFKGHKRLVNSVAFSPDGRYALSGDGGVVKLWDVATGSEKWTFKEAAYSVTFSPDGRYAL